MVVWVDKIYWAAKIKTWCTRNIQDERLENLKKDRAKLNQKFSLFIIYYFLLFIYLFIFYFYYLFIFNF